MTGRRARVTLSHRWCAWCGETIKPPSHILTERAWRAWPGQFCSDECVEEYDADVQREWQKRWPILKKGAPA